MQKEVTSHVVKGLMAVLVLIVYDLASNFLGFKMEGWNGIVWSALLLGMVIWGCIVFGTQMNHNVTFGKVFIHGFKMSAVIACIWFVYTLLAIHLIFPNLLEEMLDKGLEEARKNPQFREEDMEKGRGIALKVIKLTVYAGAVLGPLVIGVIGALLGGAFAKKRPVAEFENV